MKNIVEISVECNNTEEVKNVMLIFSTYNYKLSDGTIDFNQKYKKAFVGIYVPQNRIYIDGGSFNPKLNQEIISYEDFIKNY